jgi:hypothetical protein
MPIKVRYLLAGLLLIIILTMLVPGPQKVQYGNAMPSQIKLGQLATAMHDYLADHGRLPPAAQYSADGQPLLSWRVLLLKHVGKEGLYERFKLNEPWDSAANRKLLRLMPEIYECNPPERRKEVPAYHTAFHLFVGKGAAFEGREGLHLPQDFPKGPSNTILIVEGGEAVPWTKPGDIPVSNEPMLPYLCSWRQDSFYYATADGGVHWFDRQEGEEALRALLYR